MEIQLIEEVEPDPSLETVMKGAELMRQFNPDRIVSTGCGSPIDAAKAMWVFYEHPESNFEEIAYKMPPKLTGHVKTVSNRGIQSMITIKMLLSSDPDLQAFPVQVN